MFLRAATGGVALLACIVFLGCGGSAAPVASRCAPGDEPLVNCSNGPRTSPFTCVRFTKDCQVDVQVTGGPTWYRLEGVNGVLTEGVIAIAKRACADTWKKRIAEDLPSLMGGVCAPLEAQTQLLLRDMQTGGVQQTTVDVTPDNRAKAKECWQPLDECRS